ncbi:MAG: GDSL-type esterase/lipase family protein [Xanthobacter sp.]
MGAALASGLADAYLGEWDSLAVIARPAGQGGYLPEPENWVSRLPDDIRLAQPNVTILAMGAHDLKTIDDTGFTVAPFSDRWLELYGRRVDEVLATARTKAGRVIVVGLVPVSNEGQARDYARLNDVLRSRAAKAGLPFVNVWDGFVDEAGNYLSSGPAVDGQSRELREEDGRGFTRAGRRKLAFFVQKEVDRLLPSPSDLSDEDSAAGGALVLAGGPGKTNAHLHSPIADSSMAGPLHSGIAPRAIRGRVDNFSWPPPQGPEALPARPDFRP